MSDATYQFLSAPESYEMRGPDGETWWKISHERLAALDQLDREGLGPALDMMLDLFNDHGLHKTGERIERRWEKLSYEELVTKALHHLENGAVDDLDSGLPQYAHAVMRGLMCLQRIINSNKRVAEAYDRYGSLTET